MTIRLAWADLGTNLRKESPSRNPPHPFMDLGWWTQERGYEHLLYQHDSMIRATEPTALDVVGDHLNPWPLPFNNHMWLDRTDRYTTIEGWYIQTYAVDQEAGTYHELPRCPHQWLDLTYEPPEVNPQECVNRPLKHHNPAEAALWNPTGAPLGTLTRLPLKSEDEAQQDTRFRAYTHLKEPILTDIQNEGSSSIVLCNPNDSILFAPFDFRHPEWYQCIDENGNVLPGDNAQWLQLRPNQDYVIHLRPRWWRITVFVLAHYAYISLWGIQLNDEFFWYNYYDRPPVYPYRTDVIHSKQNQGAINWNNDYRSYDIALDYYFETTNAAADLSRQILDQQYSWYCVVYTFLDNEFPDLFMEAWPPRKGEIVCCIEHVDRATGASSPVFVRQTTGLDSVYPSYQWGAFLVYWKVVPEPARWGNF